MTRMERIHGVKPTHGASGVGNVQSKPRKPGWIVVLLLLLLVLLIGSATVLYLDIRRGELVGTHTPQVQAPTPNLNMTATSVDDVKERLQRHGFDVDFLRQVTDPQLLAFEYVQTFIDKYPARIMTFKDKTTAILWIQKSDMLVLSKGTWAIATNNRELAQKMSQKLKVVLYGG